MGSTSIPQFRKFIFSLCEELSSKNLDSMKYLCRDLLTTRELEGANNATDLFVVLEQRKELGSGNFHLLEDLLTQIGRGDLVRKSKEFERKQQNGRIVCVADNRHDRRKDGFLNHRHLQDDCVTDGKQAITMPGNNKEFGYLKSLAPHGLDLPIKDLTIDGNKFLAQRLNGKGNYGYFYWQIIADKLDLFEECRAFEYTENPTGKLLTAYGEKEGSTIRSLIVALREAELTQFAHEIEQLFSITRVQGALEPGHTIETEV